MKNKVLIIVGMHRSGTSLISQWLYKCGLHIGEHLLEPNVGNIEGHYEDLDFVRMHEKILKSHSLAESGLIDHPVSSISFTEQEQIENTVTAKKQINYEWGWKDPRTCLFLWIYRKIIPDAYYLVIVRDYQSTISSLINRMYEAKDKKYRSRSRISLWMWEKRKKNTKRRLFKKYSTYYLDVWIVYYKEILHHLALLPKNNYIIIEYKDLLTKDKDVFCHLQDQWNFSLNYHDFKRVFKKTLINNPTDVEQFIKDKTLLAKATKLSEKIREKLFYKMHLS